MLVRLAPLLFVLLWSSSFIAAKTGLKHLSPLLFIAIRLAACATVLVAVMAVLGRSWRSLAARQWLHCAVAGALLNAVGLMGPHVGLLTAPAAHIALVQSLTPLMTAIWGETVLRERLSNGQWTGLILGLTGVGLVVGQAAVHSAAQLHALLLTFVGVLGLVSGTLYFGRFCRRVPLLEGATAQFLSAAVVAAATTLLLETPHAAWTGEALLSVAWNTAMVSLGGMALYSAMLARGTAAATAANFYLVPGTAALLSWLLLAEELSLVGILGLLVAAVGCRLVNALPAAPGDKKGERSR